MTTFPIKRLGFFTRLLDQVDAAERYRLATQQIQHAEKCGFDSAWIAQHHFHEGEGGLPAPFVFLSHVAAHTSRIRLGTGIVTLPLESSSVVPFRVTGVELVQPAYPLLEPVGGPVEPVSLGPFGEGAVVLELEFANCRYYHERANNTYDQVRLTGTALGREATRTVDLAVPLVVHSQVILDCPERTFVRGDDRRV